MEAIGGAARNGPLPLSFLADGARWERKNGVYLSPFCVAHDSVRSASQHSGGVAPEETSF